MIETILGQVFYQFFSKSLIFMMPEWVAIESLKELIELVVVDYISMLTVELIEKDK